MRLCLWFYLMGCLGIGFEASAYSLPSSFLIETFAKKHVLHSQLLKITTLISDPLQSSVSFKEVAYFDGSRNLLRFVISDSHDTVLGCLEQSDTSFSLITKLLFSAHSNALVSALKGKNIPVRSRDDLDAGLIESTSLVRLDQQIEKQVWKIGSLTQPAPLKADVTPGISLQKETWEPALFIEKDSFLPLRLVYEDFREHQIYEFNFSDYKYFKEFPYPKLLTVGKKGELLLSAQMIEGAFLPHSSLPALKGLDLSSLSSTGRDLLRLYYASVR